MSTSANLATVAEAAAALSTSRFSILRLVRSGRLVPVQKLPGRTGAYLFAREDVDALAAQRRAS